MIQNKAFGKYAITTEEDINTLKQLYLSEALLLPLFLLVYAAEIYMGIGLDTFLLVLLYAVFSTIKKIQIKKQALLLPEPERYHFLQDYKTYLPKFLYFINTQVITAFCIGIVISTAYSLNHSRLNGTISNPKLLITFLLLVVGFIAVYFISKKEAK